jgi:hypothetical protein
LAVVLAVFAAVWAVRAAALAVFAAAVAAVAFTVCAGPDFDPWFLAAIPVPLSLPACCGLCCH